MLGAAVGQQVFCVVRLRPTEAGTEECACPLPEDQGALSFWNVRVHAA